ncbi:Hypothetical predicted protein, partial [Paramuricea clavata]
SCPPLSAIPNGNINGGKQRTHGSHAIFSCNAGYQQIGSSLALCNDGTWSEKLPKCLAICRPIPSIKNGKVIGKGRLHIEGDKISFTCNPNYMLEGEEAIRCTSTGQWNASEPVCKLQVQTPSTTISTTSTTAQATTQVQIPSTTISTTSATTKTTTQVQIPSTTISTTSAEIATQAQPKNCPDIPKIRKAVVNGSGVIPGSKRTFSCYNHWELSGSSETTCLNNGQWSKPLPTCKLT